MTLRYFVPSYALLRVPAYGALTRQTDRQRVSRSQTRAREFDSTRRIRISRTFTHDFWLTNSAAGRSSGWLVSELTLAVGRRTKRKPAHERPITFGVSSIIVTVMPDLSRAGSSHADDELCIASVSRQGRNRRRNRGKLDKRKSSSHVKGITFQ